MKTSLDCIPCFVRQALEAAKLVSSNAADHEKDKGTSRPSAMNPIPSFFFFRQSVRSLQHMPTYRLEPLWWHSLVTKGYHTEKNHDNTPNMDNTMENECEDLTVTIPCELADRVRKYEEKTSTDLSTIMIEALDAFLRDSKQ